MNEPLYPAEAPVDLRGARKITPTEPTADLESDVLSEDHDTDTYSPAATETRADVPGSAPSGVGGLDIDLLAGPAAASASADPARWGRRGRLNRLIPGVRLAPAPAEVEYRRAADALAVPAAGQQLIMVANPKGGQGKTTTALMLAHTLATYRRGGSGPVVWDNAEAEGTLGYRASAPGQATVWDLLEHADTLISPYAEASALARFLRLEPTGAAVLASDDSAARLEQIGAQHCRTVYAVLRRRRETVIVDTGNNRRRSNWLWTAHNAHQLVIPLVYAADAGMTVLKMLAALRERDLSDLVASAVVVAAPTAAGVDEHLRAQLRDALYGHGIGALIEVPYDPVLARGGRIDYPQLPAATTRAWVTVTGTVAASLARRTPDPVSAPAASRSEAVVDAAARIAQLEAQLAAARHDIDTAEPGVPEIPRRIG